MTAEAPTQLDRLYDAGIGDPARRDDFYVFTARHAFFVPLFEGGGTDCLALPRPDDETRVFFPFFDTEARLKAMLGDDAPFLRVPGADFFAPMKSGALAVLNPHLDRHVNFTRPDMDVIVRIAQTMRYARENGVKTHIELQDASIPRDAAFDAVFAKLTDRHGADITGIWFRDVCTRDPETDYITARHRGLIVLPRDAAMKNAIETAAHDFFSVLGEEALPMIFMAAPGDNFAAITEQAPPDWSAA